MSAADEDTELRDLLVQTLDKNGVLGKIKAELRASIFLALEAQEQNKTQNPLKNTNLQKFVATEDGKMCIGIINQFLDNFHLDYTTAVFGPEANVNDATPSDDEIRHQLGLETKIGKTTILAQMLESLKTEKPSPKHGLDSRQILFLRSKFDAYDHNHCGSIDQKDVIAAITLACPLFHPDMLEKFVSEELRNTYSQSIAFDAFINLFKKLHEICSSVSSIGSQTELSNMDKNTSDNYYMKRTTPFHQVPASPTPMSEPDSRRLAMNADSGSIPSAYLMPTSTSKHESAKMDTGYDDFFDSKPSGNNATAANQGRGELPTGYTDTPAISPDSSRTGDDWPNKKLKTDQEQRHSQQYEDDFNSEQSISEDIQDMGDDLLQSSDKDESLDLTEDRTVSEIPHADYMEDIRHG